MMILIFNVRDSLVSDCCLKTIESSLLSLQHERIIKAKAGWLRVSIICLSVDNFFCECN
jgi:hypothetical protein